MKRLPLIGASKRRSRRLEVCARSVQVNLDAAFLKRGVNEGFSGGEKKRNEIMQMLLPDDAGGPR